jgi:hypothetical protein
LPTRSTNGHESLAIDQPHHGQAAFGNIVTAVYAAILREVGAKGDEARFLKVDRGLFGAR